MKRLKRIRKKALQNRPDTSGSKHTCRKGKLMNHLNVVLLEPEIPQNTGNIARTCAATGVTLHMIEPFGFAITDKNLKRAGLDYWRYLEVYYYKSLDDFRNKHPNANCLYFTTKGGKCYTDADFSGEKYLFFGKETKGLPEELLLANEERAVRIPMIGDIRSLNLSNSVAIAVYEGLRQTGFTSMRRESDYLTGLLPDGSRYE